MNMVDEKDRIANLRALLTLQWTWPGKKTLFMGSEFGQWKEWDFDAPLDWALLDYPQHDGLRKLVADLNRLYLNHATWAKYDHTSDKFQWIDCDDREGQTLSFLKYGDSPENTLLVACNFSDQLRHRDWGCPHEGYWQVIFDSDSPEYKGLGAAGGTEFHTFNEGRNSQPFGLSFSVNKWSVRILEKRT
jgi:1,4-alpha-glucan branching enzyme